MQGAGFDIQRINKLQPIKQITPTAHFKKLLLIFLYFISQELESFKIFNLLIKSNTMFGKGSHPPLSVLLTLIILFSFASVCQTLNTEEEVPTTFGLITVTHARAGDNSQFEKYLNKYALMDCPVVTEINIVWNNQQSMEEMGVYKNKDQWKRKVNFFRTPSNSMNWRFKIAKETTSKVFFSIDDDITVGCQELKKGFEVWRQNALGSIGPIVSYGPRYYEYSLKTGFQYGKGKTKNVFNIGLVGLAFISRHFMDLYYTDLFEIKQMRDYIVTKNNCDDIGLNWVIQYYYPELKTITIDGDLQNISPKIAQATGKSHYPFRTQCLQKFTQIFGMSLRYTPLSDGYPGKEKRMTPLRKEIVLAKKEYLEKFVINSQGGSDTGDVTKILEKGLEQSQSSGSKSTSDDQVIGLSNEIDQLKSELESYKEKEKAQGTDFTPSTRSVASTSLMQAKTKQALQLSEQLRYTLYWRSYLELGMALVIVFLLWRLLQCSKQKSPRSRRIKLQSNELDY